LLLTDTNGIPYWVELFTRDTTNEYGRCIIDTRDRGFLIVGYMNRAYSDTVAFSNDVLLIKTNKSGTVQRIDYVDINKGDDCGFKVIEYSNRYFVTGYTRKFNTTNTDIFLMQVFQNGVVNWIKTYGDTLGDFAYS